MNIIKIIYVLEKCFFTGKIIELLKNYLNNFISKNILKLPFFFIFLQESSCPPLPYVGK